MNEHKAVERFAGNGKKASIVLAAEAVHLVSVDPARARAMAGKALVVARADGDSAAASTAERALGLAADEDHDLGGALRHFRRAVRIAESANLPIVAARARVSLAGALASEGKLAAALREVDRAGTVLCGHDLALLRFQRAHILQFQGRLEEALEGYRAVLPELRRAGDQFNEATVLNNQAIIFTHLGDLEAAQAHLLRAEQLYVALGYERSAADARLNLGWAAAHRGDVPTALVWLDRADDYFQKRGLVDAFGLRDRCEALLAAGLVAEARQAAEGAVEQLAHGRMRAFLAEARLMLSETALLEGDLTTARAAAEAALAAFARQRRPRYGALARFASLRAAWYAGERSAALLAAARRTARALDEARWTLPALDARLIAARLAVDLGRLEAARHELTQAARARRRGPVGLRSRAWHAEAILRLADGNPRGAEAALRAGMRMIDRYRAALGATELRAHVSVHAVDLARDGLRLALQDASPARVLAWAERWRAGCLQLRPVRPPDDAAFAADLAELRRVAGEVDKAAREGRTITRLLARQAALEESVRRHARHASGIGLSGCETTPSVPALRTALGERALIEMVELDDLLYAVVIAAGRPRLYRLGSMKEVTAELESLRFAFRRLALGHGSPASHQAVRTALTHAARRLDDLLVAPLRDDVTDRPLVIIPTGALHALPWSVLPSCAGRPVSVAPSAALWHRAATADGSGAKRGEEIGHDAGVAAPSRVVLVAGPGLPAAADEVAELSRRYPDALSFGGEDATVAAVAAALDGADLVHIGAHGRFRADNPLFSSLELADGPLNAYDLEALQRAPRWVVLSACDSGLSAVRPGDELMGLATALFALGTQSLVASVVPVRDTDAHLLMVALHQALRTGLEPAEALAQAQARQTAGGSPVAAATAASFVCFGAG